MSRNHETPQINVMEDGRVIVGEYPDPAMQSTIDVQSQAKESKRERSRVNFQATVDISNLNDKYTDALTLTEKYFANEGLEIAPLRVISRDTLQRAYNVAGQSDEGLEEGRNVNGRALVIENQEMVEFFGDEFVLGIALHEAAHSTSGNNEKMIRTVREHDRRVALGGIAISERSLGRADLRRETEYKVVGDFWEEAFADLTRVRALRTLGRVHDLEGNSNPFEPVEGVTMVTVPNGTSVDQPNTISFPAEFAVAAKTVEDKNWSAKAPPNYAAYALELLDSHTPGLYEDLKAARTNPVRQRDAIQKIESVQPGLYRELRDLEYTEKDFVQGLTSVLEALKKQSEERDGSTIPYSVSLTQKRERILPMFELTKPERKTYTLDSHYSFLVHVPLGDVEQRLSEIGAERDGVLMTSLLNETRQGTFCGEGGLLLEAPARNTIKGMSRVDTGGEIVDGRMDSLDDLQASAASTEYNQIDLTFDGTRVVGVMLKVTPDGQELGTPERNAQLREIAERHNLPISLVEVAPGAMPEEVSSVERDFTDGGRLTTYDIPDGSNHFLRVDIAHGNFYHSPSVNTISRSMIIDRYGQVSQMLSTEQEQRIREELSRFREQGTISEEELRAVIDGFLPKE